MLSTASGEYENALRLLQGGEGVDDAAACAKKICECALLVLKAQPKIALKGMLDALANHPSRYLSTKNEDLGIVALTNICACYDISPSDASAKMAFFREIELRSKRKDRQLYFEETAATTTTTTNRSGKLLIFASVDR